jgi:peptide methionine sulfoxide reductase MsrB
MKPRKNSRSEKEWKEILSDNDNAFQILRNPLFSSDTKFDSGSGWH